MSYVGSAPSPSVVQFSTLDAQSFNGDNSTTAFTLNRAVSIAASIEVTVNNVQQSPYDGSYTVNGTTTLTFSEAPSSGTDNVYVRFLDYPLASITPGDGTVGIDQLSATGTPSSSTFLRGDNSWQAVSVTPTAVSDQANSSTGYFDLPAGTTAQRPGTPATGMIRYNTSNSEYEVYDGSAWVKLSTETAGLYTLEYLIVAGGGGGISRWAQVACGGSGAGGVVSGSLQPTIGNNYTITVGAGATGYTTTSSSEASATASNGSNSSAFSQTAIGGGGGHGGQAGTAGSGGSGGGAGAGDGAGTAGSGTLGQGYAGGTAVSSGTNSVRAAGGGGGAGAAGGNASSGTCGAGGVGTSAFSAWGAATSTGENVGGTYYYAGGSGGASTIASTTPQAAGGYGGGAAGKAGLTAASPGNNGTANTGGGGGPLASTVGTTLVGGNGGSGIVIIRYAGSQRGSGGTVTSSGGYTYHTFTTSGTYTA